MTDSERSKDARKPRAGYITDSRPAERRAANDPSERVTVQIGELLQLIEDVVSRAVPATHLDRLGLARCFKCSPGMVDKLRREGMPTVYLGDSPRFDYHDCIRWLNQRTLKAVTPE